MSVPKLHIDMALLTSATPYRVVSRKKGQGVQVDLNCRGLGEPTRGNGTLNVFSVIDETFRVVMNVAQKRNFPVPTPDIVLQPPVGDVSILDLPKSDKLVATGYEHTISEWQRFIGAAECQ